MLTGARQPGSDGGLPIAEDPLGGGWVQPFGERRQYHCDLVRGVFRWYKGVWRRALNVVRQAWQRNVWICSARPCVPSPTRAWMWASVIPKYGHFRFGQAKPSVFT